MGDDKLTDYILFYTEEFLVHMNKGNVYILNAIYTIFHTGKLLLYGIELYIVRKRISRITF